MPVVLDVSAFAPLELRHISVTVLAAPVVFYVSALAFLEFRVVEITVVATPTILNVSAFASFELGNVPMVGLEHPKGASGHSVTVWVANMAGGAGPVVFDVFALRAFFELGDVFLAVVAVPIVLDVSAFAFFELGYLKVAVLALPAHHNKTKLIILIPI